MDRILNMIVNILLRRGINEGINAILRRTRSKPAPGTPPAQPQTPEEAAQAAQARQLAARARQAARLGRKL